LCARYAQNSGPLALTGEVAEEQLRVEIETQKQVFLAQQAGLKLEEGRLKENS